MENQSDKTCVKCKEEVEQHSRSSSKQGFYYLLLFLFVCFKFFLCYSCSSHGRLFPYRVFCYFLICSPIHSIYVNKQHIYIFIYLLLFIYFCSQFLFCLVCLSCFFIFSSFVIKNRRKHVFFVI